MENHCADSYDYHKEYALGIAVVYVNDIDMVHGWICSKETIRYCLKECYQEFVNCGQLVPLEKLDEKTKLEIFNESKELCGVQTDETKLLNICKCLYTLNFLFENFENEIREMLQHKEAIKT